MNILDSIQALPLNPTIGKMALLSSSTPEAGRTPRDSEVNLEEPHENREAWLIDEVLSPL
jgi:hypothetical protein